MLELAGLDLTGYFPIPFTVSCPGLVTDESLALQRNFTAVADYAVHWSGDLQTYGSKGLADADWYPNTFLPFMKDYYKGSYVYSKSDIQANADDGAKCVCPLPPPFALVPRRLTGLPLLPLLAAAGRGPITRTASTTCRTT